MSGQFPPPPGAPPSPEGSEPGAPGAPGWSQPAYPPPYTPPSSAPPSYAPPSYAPPSYAPPSYAAVPGQPGWAPPVGAPPPGWRPPPGMLGAAHKPGAIPLRPLGLGDILDGAFRIIRFNPRATAGSAVLVAGVTALLSVGLTYLLTLTTSGVADLSKLGTDPGQYDQSAYVASVVSQLVPTLLRGIGTILVVGMIAHVTAAAAVGRRLGLGDAWHATRGKRWRLIALTLLLGFMTILLVAVYVVISIVVVVLGLPGAVDVLYFLFSVPAFLAALFWFWIRIYYLPVPALMLEDLGVFGAIDRGFRLTRGQFWRVFGIALLTWLITAVAGGIIGVPLGAVSGAVSVGSSANASVIVSSITSAIGTVLAAAFVIPFTSAVTSLQYLDQRMRKEAYDVELMQRAGVVG